MQAIIVAALRSIIVNWLTSALGALAGAPMIIEGLTSTPINWSKVLEGVAAILLGLSAKDANVTGGTVKQ